jgi:hypothetical protein
MEITLETILEQLRDQARAAYGDAVLEQLEISLRDLAAEIALVRSATIEPIAEWPDSVHVAE